MGKPQPCTGDVMSNLWQDLQWRGLIAQSTDEKVLSDLLNNKSITLIL
jgi:tyrosyl-tRNA synthetase